MSIKVVDGNLLKLSLDGYFDVIIHNTDCYCSMNSGISSEIKQDFPQSYESDLKTIVGDKSKLGHYTYSIAKNSIDKYFVIVNAYVFYEESKDGVAIVDEKALNNVLKEIKEDFTGMKIAFPVNVNIQSGEEKKLVSAISYFLEKEDITIVRAIRRRRFPSLK
jgi:hypothetical protein